MSDNTINSGLCIVVEATGEVDSGLMNQLVIPTRIADLVDPSLLSISNDNLSTRTETNLSKDVGRSACTRKNHVIT